MDSKTIKQRIAQSKLHEAAHELAGALSDSPSLQTAALQLQERLHRLDGREAKGIVSEADANLERNRISDALLRLADQLDLPPEQRSWDTGDTGGGVPDTRKKTWLIAAIALLAVAAAAWGYTRLQSRAQPFDLTVYLEGLGEEAGGQVQLELGSYRLQPKPVGPEREVVFQEIPGKYRGDSVRLELVDLRYRIVGQNHYTPAESEQITFVLEALPTIWRGRVEDPEGRAVADALVEVEQGLAETTTDAMGRFQLEVPRPEGSLVQVRVLVQNDPRLNRRLTLTGLEPVVLRLNL